MNKREQPTDLTIIESYISRRDKVAAMTKDFEATIAPFKEQMKTLENEMLRRLIERNAEHSNTNVGKEALKLVIDKSKSEVNPNGVVPPGLAVNFETVVRFRKA